MPADSKRSGNKKGDSSKKKVTKSTTNNAGISKNRKLPGGGGKTTPKTTKGTDKRSSSASKKSGSSKKNVDKIVSSKTSSSEGVASPKRHTMHKKKSSQQKRKAYNEASTSLVLVFPASKMRNAFKYFYVKHLSELAGVDLDPNTIQVESGVKSILLDLANCVTKPVAEFTKEFSCLKNKQTAEKTDVAAATRLFKNHDRLGSVLQ